MSSPLRFAQASHRSMVLCSLLGLALSASACGAAAGESNEEMSAQSQTLEDGCETLPPTLTVDSPTSFTLQCNDPWAVPEVSAADGCGNPLPVYRYNTGDDDLDGISGDVDPDDYGPGPNTSANGVYNVQFLTWDSNYNVVGEILYVTVENCP
jgi:hypothetical protein